jgi:UDP-N-acetylglucosamine 2-epimerase (non-hydrolysing)
MQRNICIVAGVRPNFIKIAPIMRALRGRPQRFSPRLVHTGQHYDAGMSGVFFDELGISEPDWTLSSGSGSHAEQTARIMVEFEKYCRSHRPDHVVVVGDVNSTLACSITAKKERISVSHVEAGLRSHDMSMEEEINRVVTDSIADWFFCTEQAGVENLIREGRPADAVFLVGNVMIDTLLHHWAKLACSDATPFVSANLKQKFRRYGVVTLHRSSNVDQPTVLQQLAGALQTVSHDLPLIFPMHPRTRSNVERFGIDFGPNVELTVELGYLDFLNLYRDSVLVLTDSGGLQEETTALGIPCLTLRDNTERPITVVEGSNTVVGRDPERILAAVRQVLAGDGKIGKRPALWDGRAAERIVESLDRLIA